jgi:hypothetical protein
MWTANAIDFFAMERMSPSFLTITGGKLARGSNAEP